MRGITTTSPATLLRWTTPVVVLAALLLVLGVANSSHAPDLHGDASAAGVGDNAIVAASGGDTEKLIADLQNAVRESPDDGGNYALLGDAYYQRARETGDPTFYAKSQGALEEALRLDPDDVTATVGLGTLALARHDFSEALELGRRAHALEPALVEPYPVIADAEIELGRYGAAAQTLERMVRLKPTLATYSRVSYFRELNGDLDGAVRAMRLAVAAGGGAGEGSAYVQSLLGTLELERGRVSAAETAYREALAAEPEFPAALAGLAPGRRRPRRSRPGDRRLPRRRRAATASRVRDRARRGGGGGGPHRRGDAATTRWSTPRHACSRPTASTPTSTWPYSRPTTATQTAPSSSGAAPGARRRACARRTPIPGHWPRPGGPRPRPASRPRRCGSARAIPSFLYHAGLIARDAGRDERARRLLGALVAQSPRFSPLYGPRAERALEALR